MIYVVIAFMVGVGIGAFLGREAVPSMQEIERRDLLISSLLEGQRQSDEWRSREAPMLRKMAQDAARYRWLRATTNWASSSIGERINVRDQPELWDEAIDAAIAASKEK